MDFGGTKIEVAVLAETGAILARQRRPTPRVYAEAIGVVRDLVDWAEAEAGAVGLSVGIGIPGSISPVTGRVRNANSTWLNDRPFDADLAKALGRPIRVANDANCFALSEAVDGAGLGARVVFGAILGTGCGGGVVVEGRLIEGRNGVAGEWGHSPLPWPTSEESRVAPCWCGRTGCLETWISGAGFERDFALATGEALPGAAIVEKARAGDAAAAAALDRYADRLARGLAVVCDLIDPDVIVCGGGMSNVPEIYAKAAPTLSRRMFSDSCFTALVPAVHGDSSGVRGAAWLWPAA